MVLLFVSKQYIVLWWHLFSDKITVFKVGINLIFKKPLGVKRAIDFFNSKEILHLFSI